MMQKMQHFVDPIVMTALSHKHWLYRMSPLKKKIFVFGIEVRMEMIRLISGQVQFMTQTGKNYNRLGKQ